MPTTYCKEHDEDIYLCPPCRNARAKGDASQLKGLQRELYPLRIRARMDSRCPSCREEIQEGDEIWRLDEDEPFVCTACKEA